MRFLIRWVFRMFILFLALLVALVLLKDTLAKAVAENRIRARTGLETRITRLEVGLLRPTLTFESLRLYNRADFGGLPLAHVPELHLEWNLKDLLLQKLHFKLVRMHLEELNIVENQEGHNNFTGFIESLQPETEPRFPAFRFAGIDTLNLTLGTLQLRNLKTPQARQHYDFKLKNEIVTGIDSLADLEDLFLTILLQHGIVLSEAPREKPTQR